jgi:hypothetical protein
VILILTANHSLAQGLTALLSSIVDEADTLIVNNTATARRIIDQRAVVFVIVDGGVSPLELASFLEMYAAPLPPLLLLVESVEQMEMAQRRGVTSFLKGNAPAELVSILEALLLGMSDGL